METSSYNIALSVKDFDRYSDTELLFLFKESAFTLKKLVYKQFMNRYKTQNKTKKQWDMLKSYMRFCDINVYDALKGYFERLNRYNTTVAASYAYQAKIYFGSTWDNEFQNTIKNFVVKYSGAKNNG